MDDVLRVERVSKTFPGTRALQDVSMGFARGEIHALLGNNGSGKSTLIKVLAGVYSADAGGTLRIRGAHFAADSFTPELAKRHNLHFVHQNPALFPMLSVAENLAMGRGFETKRGVFSRIDWKKQHARAEQLIARYHIRATPDLPAYLLDPPERTLVAIARALQDQEHAAEGVLILDEPTASLAGPEVERLMASLRRYAQAGQTIILVTHRLDEVLAHTDRVSALRDGRHVGTAPTCEMNEQKLVALMLGNNGAEAHHAASGERDAASNPRETSTPHSAGAAASANTHEAASNASETSTPHSAGAAASANTHEAARDYTGPRKPAALACTNLQGGPVRGLSFEVRPGEVLGLAGLLGAGASHVLRLLFGAAAVSGGSLQLAGQTYAPRAPADAIARGVAYVPPDRATESSFAGLGVRQNLSAVNVGRYFQGLRLRHDREATDARANIDRFMIRTATDLQPLSTLSGGNQQKVIVARWLRDDPRLLLLDEPTQGVAAHARAEIHGFLRHAAQSGMALIVVSSDFAELCQLCDRVLVVARGKRVAELSGPELDTHKLTELAHFAPAAVTEVA
jgi:ribose transport system ATP-binding protein